MCSFSFFFQAEDGIRDVAVTGVQTCALPIFNFPVVFAQDKGKLTIKLGGQTVGHEEFEIARSGGGWLAKGTAEIKPPEGSSSKVSGSLTLQADGAPVSYDLSAQA